MAEKQQIVANPTWHSGAPESLPDVIKKLDEKLQPARWIDAQLLRTFYREPVDDWSNGAPEAALPVQFVRSLEARQKFNLLRSAIESAVAMTVQVPAVEVTTIGQSDELQRSAEALGLWIDGVFADNELEEVTEQCVTDSCLTRVAAVKVAVEENAVTIRRILPHTIVWNPLEGRNPRNLFLQTPVPKAALIAAHPDLAEDIEGAPSYRPDELYVGIDGIDQDMPSEMVLLSEGYRTALRGKEKTGRYVSTIVGLNGKVVLDNEDYPHTFHCIIPLRWSNSYQSFAGSPAGDTLLAYQETLDRMSQAIDEGETKGAALRVMIPEGDGAVREEDLTNLQGSIIHHKPGQAPTFHPGFMLPPQYYEREEKIIERAFAFVGVSYTVATGRKVDGIASGKGQREVKAIADSRLTRNMRRIDKWHEAIAKAAVAMADYHFDEKNGSTVSAPGSSLLRRVSWSEIKYSETNYSIRVDSVNALSRHPSARTEDIVDLVESQIITPREGMKQMNVKDLRSLQDHIFAADNLANKMISRALQGDYMAPEPYQGIEGLQTLIDRGGQRFVLEMLQDKPSPNLGDLRKLIEQAKVVMKDLQPAPAPAPVVDPGAPPPANDVMPPPADPGTEAPPDAALTDGLAAPAA